MLQQALQSTQKEAIHSQEGDIAASLAEGQACPLIELTHSTPALQTLEVLEEIDNRLHHLVAKVEGLASPSLDRNAS